MPRIRIDLSEASRALAPNHYKQPAIPATYQQHLQLASYPRRRGCSRMRFEQPRSADERTSVRCRYRGQKLDAALVEPAQDVVYRMTSFMRMAVLVSKPCLPPPLVHLR